MVEMVARKITILPEFFFLYKMILTNTYIEECMLLYLESNVSKKSQNFLEYNITVRDFLITSLAHAKYLAKF